MSTNSTPPEIPHLLPAKGCRVLMLTGGQWGRMGPRLQEWVRVRCWQTRVDHFSRGSVIQLELSEEDTETLLKHLEE